MRRDILLGTAVGLTIGIVAYITSKKPKPVVATPLSIQIDPAIYKQVNPTYRHPTQPVNREFIQKSADKAPYDIFGFGSDAARNTDSINADSYLSMPLESDGITYKTRDMYTSLEETPEYTEKKYKYVRLTILDVRGEESTVAIGGIRFLRYGIPITNISIWNPHTGNKMSYNGEEWTDSDQWTAVFVFSEPVALTEYQIKTSMKSPDMDPKYWKLESSSNASFWSEIKTFSLPLSFDRDSVTSFNIILPSVTLF
jgi:hypothetical protein